VKEGNFLYVTALDRMLYRIDRTLETVHDVFPHFADPESGLWTTTLDGDWTGGFWIGLLWLSYKVTNNNKYLEKAHQMVEKLRKRAISETVFRCFLFYYGAAIGSILFNDKLAEEIALEGAEGLSNLYNPVARIIPLGSYAEEANNVGISESNVDGTMSIALLGWASKTTGDKKYIEIGVEHVKRCIDFFVREDGSICQSASFDPSTGDLKRRYTHKGYSDNSTWSRAQAWAMLGLALAAKWCPENELFLKTAVKVADWWIKNVPADFVAFWDFNDPAIPNTQKDTSATAIAASSLLKLSKLVNDESHKKLYQYYAEETIKSLVSNYLTPITRSDKRIPGMLTCGCYNKKIGLATNNELIWGDYYLFESLLNLANELPPLTI